MSRPGPNVPLWRLAGLLFVALFVADESIAGELPKVGARPPWTLLSQEGDEKSGYVLYQRDTDGSDASTFRLEAIIDSTPERVVAAARKNIVDPENSQANTDKKILYHDDETIVIYSYIHINAPFVSDRDVISKVVGSFNPESKVHRLDWKAVAEESVPKKDGVIRLERSNGSWTFSPEAVGKTRAVYTSHTEIAGSLPNWIVNAQMSQTMVDGIKGLREVVDRDRRGGQ